MGWFVILKPNLLCELLAKNSFKQTRQRRLVAANMTGTIEYVIMIVSVATLTQWNDSWILIAAFILAKCRDDINLYFDLQNIIPNKYNLSIIWLKQIVFS